MPQSWNFKVLFLKVFALLFNEKTVANTVIRNGFKWRKIQLLFNKSVGSAVIVENVVQTIPPFGQVEMVGRRSR